MPADPLPELTHEQYEAIRDDILLRGVQVPVEIDAGTGEVLDGRARVRACLELKARNYPRRVVSGLDTEEARRHHRIKANLLRRQLDRSAVKGLVLAEMRRKPQSDRAVAALFGLSHPTVGSWRKQWVDSGALLPVKAFEGRNGKTYRPTSIYASTPMTADRAAKLLNELGDAAPGRNISALAAGKLVNQGRRERADTLTASLPSGVRLLEGRFQDVGKAIGDASVDCIWVDPPYNLGWVEGGQWADLSRLASRVLKPGGLLCAYSGLTYLDRVMRDLGSGGLSYVWTLAIRYTGKTNRNYQRNAMSAWKPILVFGKGTTRLPAVVRDHWEGTWAQKELHEWEQPEAEAEYYLSKLVKLGSVVADPCCGSGTTLAVARRLKMKTAVGIDCDPGAIALVRTRLGVKQETVRRSSGSLVN